MDGMNMTTHQEADLNQDMAEAVRSTAMLADVTISVWGAERTDTKIMEDAKAQAGATGNVGRAIKNLLAGADTQLKATRAAYVAVRSTHYAITLPWVADPHALRQTGPRLLPNMLFEKYLTAMSVARRAALTELDKFIDGYDADVIKARANLAALADADYPSGEQVRGLFKVGFDFEPIPSGMAFRGLPPHFAGKLATSLKKKQENMLATAQAAMWEQVRDRVGHMAARLSDADAIFKENTIDSVRELVVLLPGWNIANNPQAAEIHADIEAMMVSVSSTKAIRKDDTLRASVAGEATRIAEKLKAWGL